MKFVGLALIIFAVFMIPAWIILGSSSVGLNGITVGNVLILLGLLGPAFTVLFYSRAQKNRFEAREIDFKEKLIPHNRTNFIPYDLPIKMSLFGAYFSIEKPEAQQDLSYGPLVTCGKKKLTTEEQKFENAYYDVDEDVDNEGSYLPMRN
jgi:hypothetical protein